MFGAEQPDVGRGEATAAERKRNVVIEMKILRRSTLHALATIAPPDFDLHRSWNQAVVRELNDAAEGLLLDRLK